MVLRRSSSFLPFPVRPVFAFPLVSCHEAHLPDVFAGLFLVLSPMCRTSAPCYHFLREVAPANTTTAISLSPCRAHLSQGTRYRQRGLHHEKRGQSDPFLPRSVQRSLRDQTVPERSPCETTALPRRTLHRPRGEGILHGLRFGRTVSRLRGTPGPLRSRHVARMPPTRPRNWGFHMLYLDPAFAEREFGVILPRGAHLVSASPVGNAENVKDLFTSLIEEDAESTRGRNAIAALLALILAGRHGNQADSVRPQATEPVPSQLRRMIESSPENKIPLTFLASQSNTTPTSVLRAFRRNHGVTPHGLSNDSSGQPCQKTTAPHPFSRRRGERSRFLRPEPLLQGLSRLLRRHSFFLPFRRGNRTDPLHTDPPPRNFFLSPFAKPSHTSFPERRDSP